MNKENEMNVYEKVDIICKKIDAYTTKAISTKSEVKNAIYIEKIINLINMINYEEQMKGYNIGIKNQKELTEEKIEQENVEKNDDKNKYNPSNENFCFKDKLQKNNGDINLLIEELQAEDKLGYRNAYVINEIKKFMNSKDDEKNAILEDTPMLVEDGSGFVNTIKKMISKIKSLFKIGNTDKTIK